MSTLTTNFVPQPAVYRAAADRSLKKSRPAKDIPLPEVPKVIDNGNGRRYFRGRLLGKVSFVSTACLVWIRPPGISQDLKRKDWWKPSLYWLMARENEGWTYYICDCSAGFLLSCQKLLIIDAKMWSICKQYPTTTASICLVLKNFSEKGCKPPWYKFVIFVCLELASCKWKLSAHFAMGRVR